MDKLISELLKLLREILTCQERLVAIALARQEAMRSFDVERMNALSESERLEAARSEEFQRRRIQLANQFRNFIGRGVEPTVTEIARRCGEPAASQLLGLAAHIKAVIEKLDRHSRINAKVGETVIKNLAKVLKIVTGLAQHAGLYMRNGRKAALHGIHLLEITA